MKFSKRQFRKQNVKKNMFGTKIKPRLSVFRSIKNIYIQAIDDESRSIILSLGSFSKYINLGQNNYNKSKIAFIVGKIFGSLLIKKGINKGIFDRNGLKYTGRLAKLAEGIRSSGIYI